MWFRGDKWDKNHRTKCKVWGKLNAIFSAQDEINAEMMQNNDCEDEKAIIDGSIDMIQDVDVHISLNALLGIASGSTLQLNGLIKKQKVPFLMDTQGVRIILLVTSGCMHVLKIGHIIRSIADDCSH